MKTYNSILAQMVFLLLLSQLSFSQEVEVNLGGNSTSDAFVVKDTSGNVLLKMDGDKNFGINSEQPDGIEIKGRNATAEYEDGDSIKIIGGSTWPLGESYSFGGSISILGGSSGNGGGSVSILGGTGDNTGGSVIISSGESGGSSGGVTINTPHQGNGASGHINMSTGTGGGAGNINMSTGNSNGTGGSITIATGYANGGGNNLILRTGGTAGGGKGGNSIKLKEFGIELNVYTPNSQGIILSPAGGLVQVIGSGTYTGTWTQASDERYKSNIKPLLDISNKVNLLQPVEYEWNKEEFPESNFPDGNQIGLIAQEVEKLFPEIVATNRDGYKSIDYSKISVLLIQAVKEQQNEIDKMKSELEELKSMIMQDSNKFSSTENQKEVN